MTDAENSPTFGQIATGTSAPELLAMGAKSKNKKMSPWAEYCRAVLALKNLESALEAAGNYEKEEKSQHGTSNAVDFGAIVAVPARRTLVATDKGSPAATRRSGATSPVKSAYEKLKYTIDSVNGLLENRLVALFIVIAFPRLLTHTLFATMKALATQTFQEVGSWTMGLAGAGWNFMTTAIQQAEVSVMGDEPASIGGTIIVFLLAYGAGIGRARGV
jgi:hypothetical protein